MAIVGEIITPEEMASKVDNVIKASRQRELDARQAEYEAIINSIPEGGAFKLADWHSVVTDEDTDASHRGITLRFSRAANRLGIKVEAKSMDDGSIIVKRPTLADLEAQAARTAERAARKAQAAAAPVATEGEPVDASENEPEPETVPETVPEAEAEAPAEAPAEEPRRRGRNAA